MAKRVKNTSMTLKDFYDKAPGQAPFENRLPSKPGMTKNGGCLDSTDVESVESRFSDMSLGPGYDSTNGSPFKGNGFPSQPMLHSPGPMGLGGSERSIWLPQQPKGGFHDDYAGQGWRHSPSSSFGSMGSGDTRASGYAAYRQPPPPPRNPPSMIAAAGQTLQGWSEQSGHPRKPDVQDALAKDVREEDSFHYDVRQLAPPTPPEKPAQAAQPDSPGQSWRPSATYGGAIPVSTERPRLNLKPRSKPLPEGSGSQPAAEAGGHRPRLQLQPRSRPLSDQQGRNSSIFGATRLREDILKERGVDPIAADLGLPAAPLLAQPAAATAPPALRKIAVHQEETEWQTVGSRRGRQGDNYPAAATYLTGENPLLSHAVQTAPRAMYLEGPHTAYGSSYYQHGAHGGMYGAGPSFWAEPDRNEDSDFPGRRGLPTRQDDLF